MLKIPDPRTSWPRPAAWGLALSLAGLGLLSGFAAQALQNPPPSDDSSRSDQEEEAEFAQGEMGYDIIAPGDFVELSDRMVLQFKSADAQTITLRVPPVEEWPFPAHDMQTIEESVDDGPLRDLPYILWFADRSRSAPDAVEKAALAKYADNYFGGVWTWYVDFSLPKPSDNNAPYYTFYIVDDNVTTPPRGYYGVIQPVAVDKAGYLSIKWWLATPQPVTGFPNLPDPPQPDPEPSQPPPANTD